MIKQYFAKISGTGKFVPRKVMTNHDLEKIVDTNDEWIQTRTGMMERRIADPEHASSDLATFAAKEALDMADLKPKNIDLIITASVTPDHAFPSTACLVQKKLGIKNIPAFDISAGCTGFIYASDLARQYIENGTCRNVLVIGVEILTRIVNWEDRGTCVLFGDGAGAAVWSRAEGTDISKFIDSTIHADGQYGELLIQPAGGSAEPASEKSVRENRHTIVMEGNKIFKLAIRSMATACEELLKRNKLDIRSVDWLIPHQANMRIIEALGKKLKIDSERVIVNIQKYANTSAATVPIALDEAIRSNKIRKGDLLLMVSFGAGLTSGSLLVRY